MLSNIFGGGTDKKVHCERNGKETSIDKTRVLTKMNGVINLKLFQNPEIDYEEKTIYSSNKRPIKFFTKVHTPPDLKPILGDLFVTVDDEDEAEQTTSILSDEGMNHLMGSQLIKLISHLKDYELIKFPETMFFVSANDTSNFNTQAKTCDNWGSKYPSVGKKYVVKRILETKKESMKFGYIGLGSGVLWPGFDVAVSDVSEKNPNGTGYQFKTDNKFTSVNLCSNESAVDYCDKNNCIVYYTDFMNGGKMRILTKYTPDINAKLQNDYRFRSSNI
jgi:hypothetical protein